MYIYVYLVLPECSYQYMPMSQQQPANGPRLFTKAMQDLFALAKHRRTQLFLEQQFHDLTSQCVITFMHDNLASSDPTVLQESMMVAMMIGVLTEMLPRK